MSSNTHRHHGETKGQQKARRILAFFLFIAVALLSLSVCVRVSFVSKTALVNTLTSDTYVSGAAKSAVDYSHDLCDEVGIPYDSVDKYVNYDSIYSVQKAYYNGFLKKSAEYTDTAYKDSIDGIGKNLKKSTLLMLKEKGVKTEGDAEKSVDRFCKSITDYITEITELPYSGVLGTIVNIGGVAGIIAIAVFAVMAILLALIIVSIGSKLHRALREIAFSFYAAALLNILLIAGVEIVKSFKTLVLYPRYLGAAVMEYVNNCIISVGWSSFALFLCGLALTATVWLMNKNENN